MKYILIFLLSITTVFGGEHIKILKEECRFPRVAIAIMNHESANQTSNLAVKYNNLFGFKGGMYSSGKTKGGYCKYRSKFDSARAYIYFEDRVIKKFKITSRNEYLEVLNKLYAYDPEWKSKILKHLNN